jgi:hypothetical protein
MGRAVKAESMASSREERLLSFAGVHQMVGDGRLRALFLFFFLSWLSIALSLFLSSRSWVWTV